MTDYTRPSNVPAWAESGDKTEPTTGDIQSGWPNTAVPPSRQRFNWILNWLANAIRYMMQIGVSEWSSTETYRIGSRVQYSGVTYKALTANTNKQPDVETSDWEVWGYTNTTLLPRVDQVVTVNVAGSADVTLTAAQGNSGIIILTGALTGDIDVILPNTGRRWAIHNGTTGSYSLSVKTATSSPVELLQGKSVTVYCDGANNVRLAGSDNSVFFTTHEFTAAAGPQTSFTITGGYEPGSVMVSVNGSDLAPSDFTATDGVAVVIPSALEGDKVVVKEFASFNVNDTYPQSYIDAGLDDRYTKAEVDAKLYAKPGRNLVINGQMRVAQRGTSFIAPASGDYTLDRWRVRKSGAAVVNVEQSSDVPTVAQAGRLFTSSLLVDITTADTSLTATDHLVMEQPIEGFAWTAAAQRACVLSFWVKSPKSGVHCVYLSNSARDRTLVSTFTVAAADTWEEHTVQLTASPSAGTWNYTIGVGAYLGITLMAGTGYHTTSGAWQAGDYMATSAQVNCADNTSNNFLFTGVQLEPGTEATEFEGLSFEQEIARCQRYFQKSYNVGVAPGANTAAGATTFTAVDTDANLFGADRPLIVQMRGTPSVTCYSTDTGTAGRVYNTNTAGNQTVNNVAGAGQSSTGYPTLTTNPTAGDNLRWQWTADAELT